MKQILENVKEFKFLGCLIVHNGSLAKCTLHVDLAKRAKKVLFAIKLYTSNYGILPVKISCNIFKQ